MTELPPLRTYQEEAIGQALEQEHLLLAMTMGSGKTRTIIETIESLRAQGKVHSGAVFVQNSTKFQWKREIDYWAGSTAQVIDGDKNTRHALYRRAHRYQYNILNYEALVHDWDQIQEFLPIDFVVADEVTNIKSFQAKRSKHLKELGYYAGYRFGMSGQPVENRPEELFSIMEFVNPAVLGSFHKFDRTFITRDHWGRPKSYKNLGVLSEKLSDAMFRRSREDIAEFLPRLVNIETPVPMDPRTAEVYDYIRTDLLDVIDLAAAAGAGGFDLLSHYGRGEDSAAANQFKGLIMSRVTCMRLLCDHPHMLLHSADEFDDEDTPLGSAYASELREKGLLDKLPASSPKLKALVANVLEILAEDETNKVVIFSGFKGMLSLIQHEMKLLRQPVARIDGNVSARDRDKAIVRFNTQPNCRVFLSSDAGAYGVNLDRGSHLISYDLPWSSGAFSQRMARIDRLSSVHGTIVIDSMFMQGTIEARQYQMLMQKRLISDAFLDGKYDSKGLLTLTLSSLREFLLDVDITTGVGVA